MINNAVMDNTNFGIFINTIFSFFGWASLSQNLECISESMPSLDFLKIIVTSAAESGIDVTSKISVLVLTFLSIITSSITIGQFVYKVLSKKKKKKG
tara:strand:+ start:648 stop:938 length:291 start_codon:yes stop_codon:yes gene_type:complete